MNCTYTRRLRMPRIVLGLLATILLSACAQVGLAPTSQPTEPTASLLPTGTATMVSTSTATTKPTITPTTLLPGQPALLGPEWIVLAQGDLYGTGVETAIGYNRSGMEPDRADLPPAYVGYDTILERLVVVERNADGQPFVRVLVSPNGVFADGQNIPTFVSGGPTFNTQGFALAHDDQSAPLRLVPLDTQGRPSATGFIIRSASAQGGFELAELMTPGVQPNWPGPAWQVAYEGDFNGDGLNEKVYVLPSTIVPDQATFDRPGYDTYDRVAQEAMIIQAQDGSLRILATLSLTEVRSEQMVLATLAGVSGRPAAFFIATPLDEATPLAAIPLDGDG
ncbi:MAG: hypothetical protein EOM24_32365, partial [Chloroflexia bacterium]|nr:hypothetical protein [Chloroflexia bacterium]